MLLGALLPPATPGRAASSPTWHAEYFANATLSGSAPRPVVLLSNVNDPTVPARFSGRYAELAKAAGRADHVLLMPPVGEGHCAFSQVDIGRALRALVDRGSMPPAE